MNLHLAAFTEAIDSTANNDVNFLTDEYLDIINSHARLRTPMNLYAAAAMSASLNRVRIDSPSIRLVGNPFIRPIMQNVTPDPDPDLMDITRNPFKLQVGEEIALQATAAPAMTERFTGLLWLASGLTAVPAGDVYPVRWQSTTAATANAWSTLVMTLDQAIAPGDYAMVGSEHQSTNAIAHRWIVPDRPNRPGFLSTTDVANRTHKLLYQYGLGQWGRFPNTSLPQPQVLCNAADNAHVGWLYLIRLTSRAPGG